MTFMNCKIYTQTHTGKKRKNNQDFILSNKTLNLYAVADGMGGHKGGEIASQTAVQVLESYMLKAFQGDNFFPEESLVEAFKEANIQVYQKAQENQLELSGMGTTLVACMLWEQKAFFANVGDSRAYFFNGSYLWRVTEDHSVLNEQLKKGLIEESQARLIKDSNVITRSIGFLPEISVDFFEKDLIKKDLFLLCSDGLTSLVSESRICDLIKETPLEELCDKCVQAALDEGGIDNISVIVVAPY